MFSVSTPVMTKEKFSELSGIPESAVDRLIKDGVFPKFEMSERRTGINLALLTSQCLAQAQNETELQQAIQDAKDLQNK